MQAVYTYLQIRNNLHVPLPARSVDECVSRCLLGAVAPLQHTSTNAILQQHLQLANTGSSLLVFGTRKMMQNPFQKQQRLMFAISGLRYTHFFRYTNYQVSLLILSVQKQMENPSETLANYRSKCSIFMLRGEAKQIGINPNHRANALRRVPCAEIGYTLYSIITPKKSKKKHVQRDNMGQYIKAI